MPDPSIQSQSFHGSSDVAISNTECDIQQDLKKIPSGGFSQLSHPVRIDQQCWPDGTVPVVSIVCITYNHERFIEEAIESFLMQETTFPVEILIHDDASTDKTASIVRRFQERYPRLIFATLQTVNQYSQGVRPATILYKQSRAPYLAFCEGDDYWTNPRKLQMQVDYLAANPGVVLVYHDVMSVDECGVVLHDSKIAHLRSSVSTEPIQTFSRLLGRLVPTLSILFRNKIPPRSVRANQITNGDFYLFAMLIRHGEIHCLGPTMGAHRRHGGGVWTSMDRDRRAIAGLESAAAVAWDIDDVNHYDACAHVGRLSVYAFWAGVRQFKPWLIKEGVRYHFDCCRCLFLRSVTQGGWTRASLNVARVTLSSALYVAKRPFAKVLKLVKQR